MAINDEDIERMRGTALVDALRGNARQLLNTPADVLQLIEVIDELRSKGNVYPEPCPGIPTEYGQGIGCLHSTCNHGKDTTCCLSCPCPKCSPQC